MTIAAPAGLDGFVDPFRGNAAGVLCPFRKSAAHGGPTLAGPPRANLMTLPVPLYWEPVSVSVPGERFLAGLVITLGVDGPTPRELRFRALAVWPGLRRGIQCGGKIHVGMDIVVHSWPADPNGAVKDWSFSGVTVFERPDRAMWPDAHIRALGADEPL